MKAMVARDSTTTEEARTKGGEFVGFRLLRARPRRARTSKTPRADLFLLSSSLPVLVLYDENPGLSLVALEWETVPINRQEKEHTGCSAKQLEVDLRRHGCRTLSARLETIPHQPTRKGTRRMFSDGRRSSSEEDLLRHGCGGIISLGLLKAAAGTFWCERGACCVQSCVLVAMWQSGERSKSTRS